MSLRNPELGYESGLNRAMGPGDQAKVKQMVQQQSYRVDVEQLAKQKQAFGGDAKTHTKADMALFDPKFWLPLTDEPAVKLRGKTSDAVFTALNGIDTEAWESYPGDAEMARLVVRSKIQFVGIVDQNARPDKDEPKVTVQYAGTVTQYAPGIYNIPGREDGEIQFSNRVVYDVPNLVNPIVAGFPQKIGKIVLVPCQVTKESIAARILHVSSHIVHDPAKYKLAMANFDAIADANQNTAMAIRNAALVNGLMMIDYLLKEKVLAIGAAAPELAGGNSAESTVKLAEALSLLYPGEHNVAQPSSFSTGLTSAQLQAWNRREFDIVQRLLPLPNPDTGKMNARNEFGMEFDQEIGAPRSQGRSLETGDILRTPIGGLLRQSLTAMPHLIQSLALAIDDENRNCAGWAASTPNQAGTAQFNLCLVPQGGMAAKFI